MATDGVVIGVTEPTPQLARAAAAAFGPAVRVVQHDRFGSMVSIRRVPAGSHVQFADHAATKAPTDSGVAPAVAPAAALGAVAVAVVLTAGTRLLAALVTRAGPVYGSFATVAGIFALLYLVSQALLFAAEIAVVRHRGLWPRALDTARPTPADVRTLGGLATEQKRIAAERIDVEFDADSSTGDGDAGSAARVTTNGEQP